MGILRLVGYSLNAVPIVELHWIFPKQCSSSLFPFLFFFPSLSLSSFAFQHNCICIACNLALSLSVIICLSSRCPVMLVVGDNAPAEEGVVSVFLCPFLPSFPFPYSFLPSWSESLFTYIRNQTNILNCIHLQYCYSNSFKLKCVFA